MMIMNLEHVFIELGKNSFTVGMNNMVVWSF